MRDAAGATSHAIGVTLRQLPQSPTVVVAPDPSWLADPSRKWPVVVDPDVQLYDTLDCYIYTPSQPGPACGVEIDAGNNGSWVFRSLLQFNTSSVPSTATVTGAYLHMEVYNAQNNNSTPVGIYQLTHTWTNGVTWPTYDGTHTWTTAGGDYNPSATDVENLSGTGWYMWFPSTSLVQGWINGSIANDGLLLRTVNESTIGSYAIFDQNNPDPSNWPYLQIYYDPGLGVENYYNFSSHQLTDRLDLRANVGNGNLIVHSKDMSIRGTGLALNVDHYYNNLSNYSFDFANRWAMNGGWDVYVSPNNDGTVLYHGTSGEALLFTKTGSNFNSPIGLNAKLVQNGDGSYTLTFNQSGEKYNFASGGDFTSDVDRNGNTIRFNYDGNGRLASISDTQGRVSTLSYGDPTNSRYVTMISDPAGRQYRFGYDDANNNLTSYTDPNLGTTVFGYDNANNNNLTQITDPKSNVTKLTYTNPTGVEGDWRVSSIQYITNPGAQTGPTTRFTYNTGVGPCTASGVTKNTVITDANNHATTYCVDVQNRVRQAFDALNHSRQTTYDSNANVTQLQDGLSAVTQLNYDNNNNLQQIQSPASTQQQTPATSYLSYHASGQTYLPSSATQPQSATSNPNGNCQAFTYDAAGNLQTVYPGLTPSGTPPQCDGQTGSVAFTNAYQGDPGVTCGAKAGELCSTTDAKNNKTSYGYDSSGNVTSITPPAPLGATAIGYDGLSRVSSVTDGNSNRTSYAYDALDRIVQLLYGGATTCVPNSATCLSYTYDGDGNLTNRGDNTGNYTFSYDALNRVTDEALPDAATACTGSVPAGLTFAYDAVGNLASYCDVNGTTTYRYDAANRLQDLAEPTGSCTSTPTVLCTTFGYNNNDRRTQTTFPGGATLTADYNDPGQQKSAIGKTSGGTVLSSFSYGYALGSRDTQLRQTVTEADPVANLTTTYSYDTMSRLLTAANSSTTLNYSYDANGNRCSASTNCNTPTYLYDTANELTASPGVSSYSYDRNGNETGTSTGDSFSYNAKNQTTAITHGGTTLSGLSYADADQTQRTAAGATSFANSPLGVMIAKTGGSSTYFVRDNQGQIIGERTPDGSHWYFLKDGLGSVVAVVRGDGSQIGARYAYDPYGQVTCKPLPSSCTVSNPWQFAAGYLESTGLYKFGTRYYDPILGRWTQQDPIGGTAANPSTVDRYTYAGDNPVNRADPTGADWWNPTTWNASCATGIGLVILGAGIVVGAAVLGGAVAGAAAGAVATADLLEGIDLAVHLPWIFALIGGAGASGGLIAGIGTVLGLRSC
jgi:RHS repeat-associated protein